MKFPLLFISLLLLGLTSCRQTEKTEAVTAQIEADQMEDARLAGRNAAKRLINREWADSTERNADMAQVDSIEGSYGDPQKATTFHSTFRSTLKTIRPDLAKQLEEQEQQ